MALNDILHRDAKPVANEAWRKSTRGAFEIAAQKGADGLLVVQDPFYNNRRDEIVALAAGHKRPVVYPLREFAEVGGLVSYGRDLVDGYRQMGVYAGRILKGEKPADLPMVQPTKFEFVINFKTANRSVSKLLPQCSRVPTQ